MVRIERDLTIRLPFLIPTNAIQNRCNWQRRKLNHSPVFCMSQKVFIPITDEVLYDHPELITSPLLPYHVDNPCFRWMATIEAADGEETKELDSKQYDHTMTLYRSAFHMGSRLA